MQTTGPPVALLQAINKNGMTVFLIVGVLFNRVWGFPPLKFTFRAGQSFDRGNEHNRAAPVSQS
jgi:hypothetical protein